MEFWYTLQWSKLDSVWVSTCLVLTHGLRTPGEEISFTAQPKIKSQSQILSIFCLPHWPKLSDFSDLCLHWVSVVRVVTNKTQNRVVSWNFCFFFCIFKSFGNIIWQVLNIFLKSADFWKALKLRAIGLVES